MSRPTSTLIGKPAREAIRKGVNAVYNTVRVTLGPEARKGLLFRTFNRGARIIDDGYASAEAQEPRNIHVRLAANAFKEACKRTNEKVGDGTATTATIAGHLYNELYKLLDDGPEDFTAAGKTGRVGVTSLRRKILASAEVVKLAIKEKADVTETLEQLEKIAIISVNDERIGKLIAKIAWEVGLDGFIDVVEGYKGELETEINKGFRFPAKIAAKAFVNNPNKFEMVAMDCPVIVTNVSLDNGADFAQVFRKLNETTSKIVVFAPMFSDSVLISMTQSVKAGYFIYPVLVPSLRTDQFEDLAIYTGANFIDKKKGNSLRVITAKDLGFLEKLIVKDSEAKEDAVATGGRGTEEVVVTEIVHEVVNGKSQKVMKDPKIIPVQERMKVLKGQLAETKEEQFKKLLERRIASMSSAVGVIKVGDSTQASSLDLKMKIEDAAYACKSALRGGHVKGGGLCLKEIAETLPEDDLLRSALMAPYNEIQASIEGGIEIGDDVLDPADAEYYAVEHATQVVANLITVEFITAEIEEMMLGEGEISIARELSKFGRSLNKYLGIVADNQEEMDRDAMGGLTSDEKIMLDQG